MFRRTELEQLRLRKELLALQCDANRLLLMTEWQQFRSVGSWLSEAGNVARRHPFLTTGLAAAAGFMAVQVFRRPGFIFGGLGRVAGLVSTAVSVWKLFEARNGEQVQAPSADAPGR